jgi:hypothetical protein
MLQQLPQDLLARIAAERHEYFEMNKMVAVSKAMRDKIQPTLTAKAAALIQAAEHVPRMLSAALITTFAPYFNRYKPRQDIRTIHDTVVRELFYDVHNWAGMPVAKDLILRVEYTGPRVQVDIRYVVPIWGVGVYADTSPTPPDAFEMENNRFVATFIPESERAGTYILTNGTCGTYSDGIWHALRRWSRVPMDE